MKQVKQQTRTTSYSVQCETSSWWLGSENIIVQGIQIYNPGAK